MTDGAPAFELIAPDPAARFRRGGGGSGSVVALPAGAPPYLVAHIDTPHGPRRLGGP